MFILMMFIPIMVAQWIGVIVIGRGRRGGAWWCMLAGTVFFSFGMIGGRLIVYFGTVLEVAHVLSGIGLLSSFGSLLFMVGFAMHALGFRKLHSRITELEMVIEAQNEQLGRQS